MKPRLYLINGPLGAGKTTLLRHLLTRPAFAASRVIENEFAAVSVDTETLHEHRGEIATIAGVCICCSTGDELTTALVSLAAGAEPVLIEATGVANSLRIIETLIVNDLLDHYDLAHTIFVLDAAEQWREVIARHHDEVLGADLVVVTKTDLVGESATATVLDELRRLGASTVVVAHEGVVDVALLDRPSGALSYFARFGGELPDAPMSNAPMTNYSVVDLGDRLISLDGLRRGWETLHPRHRLDRMKGDVRDESGAIWHVEATPHQLRVSDSRAEQAQLVLIGADARSVTRQTLLRAVDAA